MMHFRDHGDSDSWEQLYNEFAPRIRAYLLKKVGPDIIDDCANEFWLNLPKWIRKYDHERKHRKRSPLNWLIFGAMCQYKMFQRTEHQRRSERPRPGSIIGVPSREQDGTIVLPLDPHEGPEEIAMRREKRQSVRDAIASIKNPKVRDLAQKHFLEGRVAQDVADENGDKHGTAWYRLHVARKSLRQKLEPKLDRI